MRRVEMDRAASGAKGGEDERVIEEIERGEEVWKRGRDEMDSSGP